MFLLAGLHPGAWGSQACLAQMDIERRQTRPADMHVVSGEGEPGAGAQLLPGDGELRSIHTSSPRAPGWAGREQEAARAAFWELWRRGGGGAGVHWLVL